MASDKKIVADVKLIVAQIRIAADESSWYQSRSEISKIIDGLTIDQIKACLSYNFIANIKLDKEGKRWDIGHCTSVAIQSLVDNGKYKDIGFGDFVLNNSPIAEARMIILNEGLYGNIDVDAYTKSKTSSEVIWATRICSSSLLPALIRHDNATVRLTAYKRLGVVQNLDAMLDDKSSKIRECAASVAPIGCKKIEEVILKEIARGPFRAMLMKVPVEFLPMILANRNMNKRWISQLVADRMNA